MQRRLPQEHGVKVTQSYTPSLLMVEDQEWTARSIESLLRPHGFVVFKAYTGHQCLSVIPRVTPDVLMIATRLPDMSGIELIHQLKERKAIRPSTPLVILSIAEMSQAERTQAFEAGAWDIVRPPFALVELAPKMNNWIRAKQDGDAARDEGLVDPSTGVYNFKGLVKRTEEIVSDANRSERDVSFIVIGPAFSHNGPEKPEGMAAGAQGIEGQLAKVLLDACRLSDAVGRLGEGEFAVVLPHTDQSGASILAQRILDAVPAEMSGIQLRAGLYSAHRSKKDPVLSVDLLSRATAALRKAQAGGSPTIQPYVAN
jgi:two-component system chemotaxis family response regulator WspR